MDKDDCFCLGHTIKLHSFKGEISIKLDVDNPDDYKNLESVFIEADGKLVPFFIEKIQIRDKGFAVVKIEGTDNAEQAEKLIHKGLYLPLSNLPPLHDNKFYYHEIINFEVIDKAYGPVGVIKQVLDFPHQAVLQIFKGKKEVLIPVNDDIITGVDRTSGVVYTNAPEGLIELYLE